MASCWAADHGTLTIMAVLVAGVFELPIMGGGETSPSECKEGRRLLVNGCTVVIFGGNPSPSCCQRGRVTHVECLCPVVTPQVAAFIGVERTIKQIEGCGRTVPHNF